MYRILALGGLALALTSLPATAQMVTVSPAQVGQIFCIARLGNDMAPVRGLLTDTLAQAIAAAEKKNAAWAAKNPGEKPPLGDGIPWQAYPDYAPQCAPGNVAAGPGTASVEIGYTFPDALEASFTDTLHLRQVEGPVAGSPVWRIDNIGYAHGGGDLRSFLATTFDP